MKNFRTMFMLNIFAMAIGALNFASTGTTSGASGKKSATKPDVPAENGAADAAAEAVKPKRAALTVNSLEDILNSENASELVAQGQVRAHVNAGTTGQYVRADGQGFTNDKNLAKRALDGRGRVIAQYTPPRDANVVAAEELTRMLRLKWSMDARTAATAAQAKRKTPLTDEEIVKILETAGVPESYMRPKASKRLYSRVLSFVRAGELSAKEQALIGQKAAAPAPTEKATV